MVARGEDEIEGILCILLHLPANPIKKDTIRHAPGRTFPLVRQFIGAMEFIKPLAQSKMINFLPASEPAVPKYGLIPQSLHGFTDAKGRCFPLKPHRVIDIKPNIRQPSQKTIE